MTDEKYLFEQTSRERKRTARGAYAKKGGSRSKRCSLPSDYLTEKQRKELNGPVETYDLMVNEPITIEKWKRFHPLVKRSYIKTCFKQHNARIHDIAVMLGKTDADLRRELKNNHIDFDAMARESKAFRKKKPSKEWLDFLELPNLPTLSYEDGKWIEKEKNVTQEASDDVKQANDDVRTAEELLEIVSGTLNYIGDPAAIFQKVMLALDPSKRYHIQVRYQVYEEKEVSNDD